MKPGACLSKNNLGRWGAFALAALVLSACGVKATRAVVGAEHQLTVEKKGNLGSRSARTFEDRAAVLAGTLVERRNDLGGKGIPEKALTFVPFAESAITLPDGQAQVLTVLYQTRDGARVLDGIQYGSYDQETGELRAVRAFLKDPSKLLTAPKADMEIWARMNEVFREYLRKKGGPKTVFGIEEMPVITSEPARAGYLARYSRRNADGSLSRFAAIIDPSNNQVHVLYDIVTD